MDETRYHVLLEGRRLGPYDRRTIVGMRMKKALASASLLESTEGARLTVGELVRGEAPEPPPPDSGSFPGLPAAKATHSVVQAMHPADLLAVEGRGYAVPPFKGEVEVRVQTKVLRVAGRFREGGAWKEDCVKFPLRDVVHARLQGNVVELGVRPPQGEGLQRVRLDLRTRDAAGELVEQLPHAVPEPGSEPLAGRGAGRPRMSDFAAWPVLVAAALAVGGVVVWILARRV